MQLQAWVFRAALWVVALVALLPSVALADDAVALSIDIDRMVDAQIAAKGLRRAAQADDAEFLRRITLDLHGVVPTSELARRFLDSRDPEKRSALIDGLLADSRYGEHFANLWRGRLISPLANEQRLQTDRFTDWLATRFNANDGWDEITYDLLTATGKLDVNPAVAYLIEGRNPLGVTDLTDLTSHYFLGIRLNCAQCHDHPFAEWKREDYWGMAAFFAQIQTPGRPKMVYMAGVQDNPRLSLATLAGADMLEGYLDRSPTLLGGKLLEASSQQSHRAALARWMTSPDNPYFARAAVNRLWWHFFGRGIVTPVDDMHAGNPPSHPELLAALSQRFAESGFDLKFLCRAIVLSRTYQQTSRPREGDGEAEVKAFARMSVKVLSAEQMYDSLVAVLGPPARTPGIDVRLGARHEFTQFFASDGDPDPTRYDRGIPHVLRLMNSPQFAGRTLSALVSRIAGENRSADEIVEELFLTILSRRPIASELEMAREHFRAAEESRQAASRQLAWMLLMSSEFTLNH